MTKETGDLLGLDGVCEGQTEKARKESMDHGRTGKFQGRIKIAVVEIFILKNHLMAPPASAFISLDQMIIPYRAAAALLAGAAISIL